LCTKTSKISSSEQNFKRALRSFDAPPKRDDAFVVVLVQTKEYRLIFVIHDKATSVQSGFCHERGARLFVYNSKIFLPKNAR